MDAARLMALTHLGDPRSNQRTAQVEMGAACLRALRIKQKDKMKKQ